MQHRAHAFLAVAERAARAAGQREQRVPVVDDRRDRAEGVELVPARRRLGLGERAEAVDSAPGGLASHAHELGADATQIGAIRGHVGVERELSVKFRVPAAVAGGLDRGAAQGAGTPPLEQDRRARSRRPVDLVGGVEERERERGRAHPSSLLDGAS